MENSTKDRSDMEKLLKISDDTQLNHEVSEEFSLPDYVPEIRKLLVVRVPCPKVNIFRKHQRLQCLKLLEQ